MGASAWRLGHLIDDVPAAWWFESTADGRTLAVSIIRARPEQLALRERTQLGRRAQLRHLCGDDDAAVESMRADDRWFADRPRWSVDRRLEELELGALRDRVRP